jgi:16S rRNA (guanine527-N7)-methyltransferase
VNSGEFQDRLAQRAGRAGLTIPASLGIKLETYFRLLATWNRKINLTGMDLSDPTPETLDRLIVEPVLAAQRALGGIRIMDVGSGGGSPAIPFTLAVKRGSLLMVESKTRKSAFLREAVRVLEMQNAEVVTSRVESLSEPSLREAYDVLTLRAVRVEPRVFLVLETFVRQGGEILLFRTAGDVPPLISSQLIFTASIPLVDRSELLILKKQ